MNDRAPSSQIDASGWFPDPLGRYEYRYHNGVVWTADVSVDGTRYVDPHHMDAGTPFSTPFATPFATPFGRTMGPPSRTLSVLSLIAGIVAVATAWMPFIVAIGAAAAVAAVALSIVALLRVRDGRASGRGPAIAGAVLGVVALGLCSVGVVLTGRAIDEFAAYSDPGPVDVQIGSCEPGGVRSAALGGTVENMSDETRDYVIVFELFDGLDSYGTTRFAVDDVDPGERRNWDLDIRIDSAADDLRCEVFDITGPFPFDLEPAS